MTKMHADEVDIDAPLVRRLIAAQFPQWRDLAVVPVPSSGTDNAMYRLGDDMAVRLPRRPRATESLAKEQAWLPRLAPHLPLAIPVALAKGTQGEGYPWAWSICCWLAGENPVRGRIADPCRMASDLAGFIAALHRIDPKGGPAPGTHNFWRGVTLARRDAYTRDAIAALKDAIDVEAVTMAWEKDAAAPQWQGAPVWIHGDLSAGNLLADGGRLSAVIDFGGLGVGDPACDLIVAWSLFEGEARDSFRAALSVDDATWARGCGWALSCALVALPYYQTTNPAIAAAARYTIGEVLTHHRLG